MMMAGKMHKKIIISLTVLLGLSLTGETISGQQNEQYSKVKKYNVPRLSSSLIKTEKNMLPVSFWEAVNNYADKWEPGERKIILEIIAKDKENIPLALLEWGGGWEGSYQCIFLTDKKITSVKFAEDNTWTLKETNVSTDYVNLIKPTLFKLYKYNGGTNSIIIEDASILFCTLWDDKFNANTFVTYLPNTLSYHSFKDLNSDNTKHNYTEILASLFYSLKDLLSLSK